MKFIRQHYRPRFNESHVNTCILSYDNWDDYGYKTTFVSTIFDKTGNRHNLGSLKIIEKDMKGGRTEIPDNFDELNENYCSIGQDIDYYAELQKLDQQTKKEYLSRIKDCVFNEDVYNEFLSAEGMKTSLLRFVTHHEATVNFRRALDGLPVLTAYNFEYRIENSNSNDYMNTSCHFKVTPDKMPPSNIHAIIGKNGVGKTRLISGMADSLTKNTNKTIGLNGRFNFYNENFITGEQEFRNVIVVSYSIFDQLSPLENHPESLENSIPHHYIGIKKISKQHQKNEVKLKSPNEITEEFMSSIKIISESEQRMGRFKNIIKTLESDQEIKYLDIQSDITNQSNEGDSLKDKFSKLSSGHKIVLLTLTRLVELVKEKTIILIDEPENHLHPPLLGSFIRALSELLTNRNGVAIVATHSPVVLQEVPRSCVTIIHRSNDAISFSRPTSETFGENVGTLTRKVFSLEVEKSGFFQLIKESAKSKTYEELIHHFGGSLGTEARALARTLVSIKSDEENR